MSNNSFVISGDKKVDLFLKNLPKAFRKEAVEMASKPAALVIRNEARINVTKNVKSVGGMSKAAYVARSTKALKSKSRINPGYNIYVKGKDIPVGNREWYAQGYSILLGEGSYKGKRRTRSTGANRGYFKGFGNHIQAAGSLKGGMARRIFMNNISNISKSYLRSGKA